MTSMDIMGNFSDSSCTFFDCPLNYTSADPNDWNIINPLAFLTDNSTLCGYVNVTACCTLSDNGYGFLTSVCVDLLPYCIFYSFLKVMISIINYIFIYKKKVERRAKKPQDELLNRYRDNYIIRLRKLLKRSFILDIISSIYNLCIFKGYQHYASHYNTDPGNDFLLGQFERTSDYYGRSVALFFGAIGWFALECMRVFIQIFSVSSLTHLDNLKQKMISEQSNANNFYKKHERFAFWWTLIMFIIGFTFIFCNFFFEIWTGKPYFQHYKLYYRYYSIETISFYISYSLILVLILTDRILAYDGFKKQRDFRANERAQAMSSSSEHASLISLENYQVPVHSRYFDFLKETVAKKFVDQSPEEVERITHQLTRIYNEKMREHYYNLKKQIKVDTSHLRSCEPSMSYVKFLRNLNIGNFLGYALILFAYQNDTNTQYLPLYMLGFGISTVALFGFELTHNYMLYKNYFLEVDRKMKFPEEEDMGMM